MLQWCYLSARDGHGNVSVVSLVSLACHSSMCLSPFSCLGKGESVVISLPLGTLPLNLPLLTALVDLFQETFKHALLQPLRLVHVRNQLPNLADSLLLVCQVDLIQLQFGEHLFHSGLFVSVLVAVVFIEHLALLGRGALEGLVDNPGAFIILNVSANLPDRFRGAVRVEIIVLDLKVFAQGDEDIAGLAEVAVGGELKIVEGESDGEVEAVIGGFVGDDKGVFAE